MAAVLRKAESFCQMMKDVPGSVVLGTCQPLCPSKLRIKFSRYFHASQQWPGWQKCDRRPIWFSWKETDTGKSLKERAEVLSLMVFSQTLIAAWLGYFNSLLIGPLPLVSPSSVLYTTGFLYHSATAFPWQQTKPKPHYDLHRVAHLCPASSVPLLLLHLSVPFCCSTSLAQDNLLSQMSLHPQLLFPLPDICVCVSLSPFS